MICPNCGLENGKRNVCAKCGTFLNNKQTQRITDPQELRKMKRARNLAVAKGCVSSIVIMILAFVIISVLLIVILHFITKNMKWPTQEELASEMAAIASERENQASGTSEGPTVTITEVP